MILLYCILLPLIASSFFSMVVVEDLVEMFQSNDVAMREILWQRVQDSPLRK